VTVTVPDNAVADGARVETLVQVLGAGTDAPAYAAIDPDDVTVNITDDDVAGVTVTPLTVNLTEGGAAATYTVVLDSEPAAGTQVVVEITDGAESDADLNTLTFTPADWDAPQTVSVTVADNDVADGARIETLVQVLGAATDAPAYVAIDPDDVTVNIADDDMVGLIVTPNSVSVTEGSSNTYQIQLASEPAAGTTVIVDIAAVDAQTTALPAQVTFDPSNWDMPETITVEAVDDDIVEGAHTGQVTNAVAFTSTDPAYLFLTENVTANITDNDVAGVTVTPTTINPTEGGVAVTYTVELDSEPVAGTQVVVEITDGAEADADLNTLSFTPADWNVPQTMSVTVADNAVADGPRVETLVQVLGAGTDAPAYAAIDPDDVTVNIADDDVAGVTVTPLTVNLTEGGAAATYTVVLDSEPAAGTQVVVEITDGAESDADLNTLTFTPADWDTPQTVSVTVADNAVADGARVETLMQVLGAGTDAPAYAAIDPDDVTVNIADDDVAGVTVTPLTVNLTEGGAAATYTVVLDSEPAAGTQVEVEITDGAESDADLNTLTFTPADWDTPQTVTVTVADNAVADGPRVETLVQVLGAGTDAPAYAAIDPDDVTVNIADDDVAGVTVTPTAITVTEGGVAVIYTVVLETEPALGTQVVIEILDGLEADATPNQLVFFNGSGLIPQEVSVSVPDNGVADGARIDTLVQARGAATDEPAYGAFTVEDVTVNIQDNDIAGVQVTPTTIDVTEGGVGVTYEVVLLSALAPGEEVVIDITDGLEANADLNQLTFTDADWSNPQTVTVMVADNSDIDGPRVETLIQEINAVGTTAGAYAAALVDDVTVNIADDDTATIDITGLLLAGQALNEDPGLGVNTLTYDVQLPLAPSANVFVDITGGGADMTIMPNHLEFGPGDLGPKSVTITAVNDDIFEQPDEVLTLQHTVDPANDGNGLFSNASFAPGADFPVTILDDPADTPGVTVSEANLAVDEPAGTATYTVVLDSDPVDSVTITPMVDVAGQIEIDPPNMQFTSANFAAPQTFTVTAVDDNVDDGTATVTISHTAASDNADYAGIAVADVVVEVTDVDTAGVTVTETAGGTAVSEDGTTDTYTVVLNSSPTDTVVIELSNVNIPGGLNASRTVLTFTPANWNVPQTVMLDVTDDVFVELAQSVTIVHTATSADPSYNGITVADVVVSIADNDSAGIFIDPATVTVSEGTPNEFATFDVFLNTFPVDPIEVTFNGGGQVLLSLTDNRADAVPSLTVRLDEVDNRDTVFVFAVLDTVNEGLHTIQITASVATLAADSTTFGSVAVEPVTASIADELNDADGDGLTDDEEEAGFTISVYIPRSNSDGGLLRRVLRFHTNPNDPDSDGDGISDFDEVITFARAAAADGSVDGVNLDASAARQIATTNDSGAPITIGRIVRGPGQEAGLTAQDTGFLPKPVWGVRTLASDDFSDDTQTQETLQLLADAGLTISGLDTDGDGIIDPEDPAPQFNPVLFDVQNLTQEELLDFDVDRDGFPNIGDGFPEISETGIEATRGIDYSNDGTLTDGFDFGEVIEIQDGLAFRVIFSTEIPGLIGNGSIQSDLATVDNCPDIFNPDLDGDGIQDENPCQDAPATTGCCGTPLGFSLMLPIVWTMAARRGGKRRR
jgi:septum formation topological specificity factor MinE